MMDRELRRRRNSVKLTYEEGEDKKNTTSQSNISSQSLSKVEDDSNKITFNNVPNLEAVDNSCDFDSLLSSTCTSGEYYEFSEELSDAFKAKISKIQTALQAPVDREALRSLARSEGGLINDSVRRKVWPELLDIGNNDNTFSATDDEIENHKEFHQVVLDVNRSLKRFPPGISNTERIILQDQLTKLILSVIIKHPYLCYYQGYHDVAVTLLLVVGDEKESVCDDGETENLIARSMQSVDFLGSNDEEETLCLDKNNWEKSFHGPNETKEEIEERLISVPDKKQIESDQLESEGNLMHVVDEEKKNLLSENEIESKLDGNNVQTKSDVQSDLIDTDMDTEEKSAEHSNLSLNVKGTLESEVKSKGDGENIGVGNLGDVPDKDWECWHDEKECTERNSGGRVISMWCSIVALKILEHLSLDNFRGCMEPTMDATSRLLHHVFPIIMREDPQLCAFLDRSGVGPIFCLPWVLTWYGHSLSNHDIVVRLYDYFLASPVSAPLYLAAAIILYRREEILETECDMAAVHGLLSQIPDDIPFELLLSRASVLYEAYPPESLQKDVEERSNKELQDREERKERLGIARVSRTVSESALIPWPLLAVLPPQYVNRLVPWLWLTRGRIQWLGAWAGMIPVRPINRRQFAVAAISVAMYYAYSHMTSNTGV